MTLFQLISIATFSSLFFLAILTVAKKNNPVIGYRFLSLFFILVSFIFADEAFTITGVYNFYPGLVIIFQPATFAVAPAFYLAVVYLTSVNKKISLGILVHFIPFVLVMTLFIINAVTYPFTERSFTVTGKVMERTADLIFIVFLFVQVFTYLFFSSKKLKRHRNNLPLFASNLSGNEYDWINKLIIGLLVLCIVWLAEAVLDNLQTSFLFSFIYLAGTYYLGIQIIQQKDVFPFSQEQKESVAAIIGEKENRRQESAIISDTAGINPKELIKIKAERKQVLSEEKIQLYKVQILQLMEDAKPYLDCDLTLPKLASMLLLNTYQTSYLINSCFSENFYTFINKYRVDACKKMLENKEYANLSILGIGYEAGFNSKTAFNTTFKKITGYSPMEYQDQINQTKKRN